jgi:hypothetical protein
MIKNIYLKVDNCRILYSEGPIYGVNFFFNIDSQVVP